MRILMFGWEFPPHISGGLGTACYGLTKGLAALPDVELIFVVPKKWGDEVPSGIKMLAADQVQVIKNHVLFDEVKSKVEYYEINSGLIPYLGTNEYYELKLNETSDEKRLVETTSEGKYIFSGDYGQNLFQEIDHYAIVAEKLARELEFDVIHVHDWMTFPAGIAARRISGKPLVVHVHSTEFDRSGQHINPTIYSAEKQGMETADRVVAVSNLTRDIIIKNYHIAPEKVKTVYNAVEPIGKAKKSIRKRSDKMETVAFLGRVTAQKGPEYFVEAAFFVLQKLKNVRFVMAGKGDKLNEMIGLAATLNISDRIGFPGFLKDNEVVELFRNSDVFVMPSVSEPFGIVSLEAMQCGVPVIISRQSGVAEVLGNAVKVDYWDTEDMAHAIVEILENPERSKQLGEKGRDEVHKMSWQNSAARLHEIYLEMLTATF